MTIVVCCSIMLSHDSAHADDMQCACGSLMCDGGHQSRSRRPTRLEHRWARMWPGGCELERDLNRTGRARQLQCAHPRVALARARFKVLVGINISCKNAREPSQGHWLCALDHVLVRFLWLVGCSQLFATLCLAVWHAIAEALEMTRFDLLHGSK